MYFVPYNHLFLNIILIRGGREEVRGWWGNWFMYHEIHCAWRDVNIT